MAAVAELTRTVGGREVPAAGTYTVDRSHSGVEFVVRHMMVSKVRGRFTDFEGTIQIAEDPEQSNVQATIQSASVDTHDEQRDGHLRSPDFFDVEKFPTLEFRTFSVKPSGKTWAVTGDLTIHGVTRRVVLDVEFLGGSPDPWGGKRIGLSASTEIEREDFGLGWNAALETGGVVVGKKVKIELEIEAVLQ